MRKVLITAIHASLVLLACIVTAVGVDAQTKPEYPEVRNEINRQYRLEPGSTIKMSYIAGSVEVETTGGDSTEIHIVNSAKTEADLKCLAVPIDQRQGRLEIRTKTLCMTSSVNQRVTVKVPRNISLDLEFIAGDVRIGPTEALVRLNSIAGHVSIGPVQAAEMTSLARGLSMEINHVDERGIRVTSVVGGIELGASANLNARLVATSIIGNVVSDIPDVKFVADEQSDYEAQIGSGGQKITISSVRGGIHLRLKS